MKRGHCFDCDQEVEGRGPWCLLYVGEDRPCGGDVAAALNVPPPPQCRTCDETRLSWLVDTPRGLRCTTCLDAAAAGI